MKTSCDYWGVRASLFVPKTFIVAFKSMVFVTHNFPGWVKQANDCTVMRQKTLEEGRKRNIAGSRTCARITSFPERTAGHDTALNVQHRYLPRYALLNTNFA